MKIVIDPLDKKSITAAIKQLEQYEKEFRAKEEEFVRRLKEIGISVAQTGFSLADYDGINDVLIAETQNGPRAAIIAYGQAVGFIEFGTGVKFREYDSSSTEFTPPPHGSYGKGKGANPKGWYFSQHEGAHGRHTFGNVPAEAMLTARDVMVERVVQVAREVWK
jgi:hypothetical protein